jgi:hypothetical protein
MSPLSSLNLGSKQCSVSKSNQGRLKVCSRPCELSVMGGGVNVRIAELEAASESATLSIVLLSVGDEVLGGVMLVFRVR